MTTITLGSNHRSSILQAADYLGYVPLLGVGVGAARIVLAVATAIFAGLGYSAAATTKKIAVSLKFEGEPLQKMKESCSFAAKRCAGEINRGVYQEVLGGFIPGASFYADRHPAEVDAFLGATCARGPYVSHDATSYPSEFVKTEYAL